VPAERAAIYTRISKDDEGNGRGVARQLSECKELATKLKWRVVGVYEDNDVSATNGKQRPQFEALMADVEAGRVDAIAVWHTDRLYRRPSDLERIVRVIEAGKRPVPVATVTAGDIDLETASGRMIARMLGAAAAHEVERNSERQRSRIEDLAAKGLPHGGARPFGYEADRMTVREDEAELVREAYRRVLQGESPWLIAKDWLARGVRGSSGSATAFTGANLHRMLQRARYAGLMEREGRIVGDAAWPGIVDRPTWEAAQDALKPRKRYRAWRKYLLSGGVAVCGRCGRSLRGDVDRYACRPDRGGCGRMNIRAGHLEELVTGAVLAAANSPDVLQGLSAVGKQEAEELLAGLREADERAAVLAEMYAAGEIALPDYRRGLRVTKSRAEELRSSLARQAGSPVLVEATAAGGDIEEWWNDAGPADRRALVTALVDHVEVRPATRRTPGRFNPERVHIVWRA
jgi:DNA invertase Pin-like site-specific DNA recombinase